jgi:hypothetical protein
MSSNKRQLEPVRPATRRSTDCRPLRVCFPAFALVFVSFAVASPALARRNLSFDGEWSVVIETHGGACTPTLRYPIAISHGTVANASGGPAAVSGRVTPTGNVSVTVQSGGSWARGSGHLGASTGTGVWRGQGTSGLCEGTWQAERQSSSAEVTERRAPIYDYVPGRARRYYRDYPPR